MPPKKETEKVKRAFDLSKWDNIDISDDESTFHPNIENSFNVKINRTVRDRRDHEEEVKKSELLQLGTPEALKELEKLERNKKWHVNNMCEVKEERTIVNQYKDTGKKVEFAPAGANDDDLQPFFPWREENKAILEEFVSLGGDLEATHQFLKRHGDILLAEDATLFSHTHCMLTCLDAKVSYDDKLVRKAAQQSQLLSHIIELAKSFHRPTRDLVYQWFSKMTDREDAREVYEQDVEQFIEKVVVMADDKRARLKKEAEEEARRKDAENSWVAQRMHNDDKYKKVDSEGNVIETDESLVQDSEPQPLVKAMYQMSKEQRLNLAPGGLDPLEVFESLPQEMQTAFASQDVPALVALQQSMPPEEFGEHLTRCIKSGLWQQPGGDDGDEDDQGPEEAES